MVAIAVSVGVLLALSGAATGRAEEYIRRFSLGYGSPAPVATDAKGQAPDALTARYGFRPARELSTYIGTGMAYSLTSPLNTPDTAPKELRTGVAGQAGFSYMFGEHTWLNLDYKYLYFAPDRKTGGGGCTPHLLGIGLDIKF